LANALADRGHRLTCASFSPRPADANYEHLRLVWRGKSKVGWKFAPAIRFRAIRTGIYDIVHYHGDDYLCAGRSNRVRTFYGSALSEALHAESVSRMAYQASFYLFEWISCLRRGANVAISRASRAPLPLVTKVIPCGVNPHHYSPSAFKTTSPSILFVGDLHSRKRGRLLLEVFRERVLEASPACRLVVVGPEACEGPGVRYAGRLDEQALIEEYRKAWVYVMASSYEGFGVPAVEAMACGTPVVATPNAGIREIIQHNYNGLLAEETELGETIVRILNDVPLRQRLAGNGRRTVAKSYDIASIARCYEEVYESLGAGG
jgi:glycosyltransferase involved in cell wall biosynthesis